MFRACRRSSKAIRGGLPTRIGKRTRPRRCSVRPSRIIGRSIRPMRRCRTSMSGQPPGPTSYSRDDAAGRGRESVQAGRGDLLQIPDRLELSGEEAHMFTLTRRSLLRGSVGLAATGALARPYIANAAATTVETWWNQGFFPEEDTAFRALVGDYEKASGNKIDYALVPNAPLRQKEISAIQ